MMHVNKHIKSLIPWKNWPRRHTWLQRSTYHNRRREAATFHEVTIHIYSTASIFTHLISRSNTVAIWNR